MTPSCKLNITGLLRHESGGNYLDTRRDHGGSLLGDSVDAALQRQRSMDFPRGDLFANRIDRRLPEAMVTRIMQVSDEAIQDACVLGETLGSVILPDQADLAEALIWRRNELRAVVDQLLFG